MSHELRTPLNAIIGFAEMMENALSARSARRATPNIAATSARAASTCSSMIDDILDMARLEARRVRLSPARSASRPRSRALVRRGGGRQKGIDSASTAARADLLADRRALQQILVNLLANAVKFTPAGGRVNGARPPRGGEHHLSRG